MEKPFQFLLASSGQSDQSLRVLRHSAQPGMFIRIYHVQGIHIPLEHCALKCSSHVHLLRNIHSEHCAQKCSSAYIMCRAYTFPTQDIVLLAIGLINGVKVIKKCGAKIF